MSAHGIEIWNAKVVVATPSDTPTAQNARVSGRARAALDGADDVVIFDTDAAVFDFNAADESLIDR